MYVGRVGSVRDAGCGRERRVVPTLCSSEGVLSLVVLGMQLGLSFNPFVCDFPVKSTVVGGDRRWASSLVP